LTQSCPPRVPQIALYHGNSPDAGRWQTGFDVVGFADSLLPCRVAGIVTDSRLERTSRFAFRGHRYMAVGRILQLVGLGLPYALSVGIYGIFLYLDKKASGAAKKALTGWLKNEPYARFDLQAALISAFDRIYGAPLGSLNALRRSALYTSAMMLSWCIFLVASSHDVLFQLYFFYTIIPPLITTIASDYMSLFIVRKFLDARIALIPRVLGALITGAITVSVLYFSGFVVSASLLPEFGDYDWGLFYSFAVTFPAALLIHLWLPAFAVGAAGFRILKPMLGTIRWMQWFLKRGNDHPLEAIGLTSAMLTFLVVLVIDIVRSI
jgi:hypothetical protein